MAVLEKTVIGEIKDNAINLKESVDDYDKLIEKIGNAHYVLIGEATHGTHEFYKIRAEITKRLIKEKQFSAVAVEADWPDAYRVNRYIMGMGNDKNSDEALNDFKRFPVWMWRNTIVLDFIEWLKNHNEQIDRRENRISFYGLDLYSLQSSREEVINYLNKVDPEAAKRARYRYSCFDHYGEDPQSYGYAAGFDLSSSCESEVVLQLADLVNKAFEYMRRDGFVAEDEYFFAEQNARIVKNAEEYYRSMFGGRVSTWNLRDQHMADTIELLLNHMKKRIFNPKIVVWEHNSHLGDARATEMGEIGELNVGQLVRQKHGEDSFSIGFSTYNGTVTAASDWGGSAERKAVRPGLKSSYEDVFHKADIPNFMMIFENKDEFKQLNKSRLERAIGVIYLPQTERISHYFMARIADQFNALIYFDKTSALVPLESTSLWERGELPETYPTGM